MSFTRAPTASPSEASTAARPWVASSLRSHTPSCQPLCIVPFRSPPAYAPGR